MPRSHTNRPNGTGYFYRILVRKLIILNVAELSPERERNIN